MVLRAVLVWMTQNLGVIGYAAFSGVQQLIVITGLHHVFGAIESQLLVDTGRNFLNPLMSVAIIAQGGAVLGYLARNIKNARAKELCIPSFISVLFGITEPALFRCEFKIPLSTYRRMHRRRNRRCGSLFYRSGCSGIRNNSGAGNRPCRSGAQWLCKLYYRPYNCTGSRIPFRFSAWNRI